MFIPEQPQFYETSHGYLPVQWSGRTALDGSQHPWSFAQLGSLYHNIVTGEIYKKTADNKDSNDWSIGLNSLTMAGASDFTDTTGAGTDGYSMVWDNATGKFVLSATSGGVTDHGALTGLSDDDHTQYLLASGSRAGAVSSRQVFTSGITTESIRPASDSTTAIQFQNVAGTAIVNVDTTTNRLGVGTTAPATLIDGLTGSGSATLRMRTLDSASTASAGFQFLSDVVTVNGQAYSAAAGGGARFNFTTAGGYMLMGTTTAHVINFFTDNVRRMTLSANGSLGIGTHLPTATLDLPASTTDQASLRIRSGTAPTSPNDGDIWFDGTDLKIRVSGATYTLTKA